jgi:hypothetical protein
MLNWKLSSFAAGQYGRAMFSITNPPQVSNSPYPRVFNILSHLNAKQAHLIILWPYRKHLRITRMMVFDILI